MKLVSLSTSLEESVSHNPEIKKRVMLRKGDLPHLTTFAQSQLMPGQMARDHEHVDMFEVFFVKSGTGTICIDGVEHSLQTGVCVAVEPGETHAITNSGSANLILIYFGIEV